MRNKILSKESIIDSGEEIIKNKGLEACTVRALAKKLDCGLGTIYNYFPSRDAFLRQVFIHSWDKTFKRINRIVELEETPDTKFTLMFDVINEDISNRNGIGEYILQSTGNKAGEEDEISKYAKRVIRKLLLESPRNKEINEQELKLYVDWIYYGSIMLRSKNQDMSLFKKVILDKFF